MFTYELPTNSKLICHYKLCIPPTSLHIFGTITASTTGSAGKVVEWMKGRRFVSWYKYKLNEYLRRSPVVDNFWAAYEVLHDKQQVLAEAFLDRHTNRPTVTVN
jgi:hypothetical protein